MKKIFWILIFLIILNSVTLIYLSFFKKNNNELENSGKIPGEKSSFELNEKVFPENYLEFEEKIKKSKINKDEIYKVLYKYVKELKNVYYSTTAYNNEQLLNYYENNKKMLSEKFKISTQNNFLQLHKAMNLCFDKYNNYKTVQILTDSLTTNNKIECKINIVLDNGKTFTLLLHISDFNSKDFQFIPLIEE